MNYLCQTGSMDCFPTCFLNAVRHFDIVVSTALKIRLDVFRSGTAACSIFATEERIAQAYGKSLQKFMAEWQWAEMHGHDEKHHNKQGETAWATDLIDKGIVLSLRNGPIEQKLLLLNALNQGHVCICDVSMSRHDSGKTECKHAILLLRCADGKLYAHDPQINVPGACKDSAEATFATTGDGANCVIDAEYFFGKKSGSMKPETNEFMQDHGYRFMIVSGAGKQNG